MDLLEHDTRSQEAHQDTNGDAHGDAHGQEQAQREREAVVQETMRSAPPGRPEAGWKRRLHALQEFWTKVNNDWGFNLSAMLAYNLLMSIFPILLVLLAAAGFVLDLFGGTRSALEAAIIQVLPPGVGASIVPKVIDNFTKSSGVFAVIGIVTAAYFGSRLFIVIANCFNVIFRLRPRDALHQNIMAFSMMLLFIILVPFVFLSSSVANVIAQALFRGAGGFGAVLIQAAGVGTALLAAVILFAAIYIVVPNRPVHIKEVWRGALTGAALLVLYELVFPLYQRYVLKPDNYGATAGFAIVILVFFYYFAFIMLLGAEVNSWAAGQRETAAAIPGILHEVQAHDTTRGAAGPTAGTPTEDVQSGEGKAAMHTSTAAIAHERVDHKVDEKPPKFAEATSPHPQKTAAEAEQTTGYDTNRPTHRPEPGAHPGSDATASDGRRSSAENHAGSESAEAFVSGPSRPEYAHPQPPEARDLPDRRRHSALLPAISAAVTAAVPLIMWLVGRHRRPA